MATLGFVRNNPWVQRDRLGNDFGYVSDGADHFRPPLRQASPPQTKMEEDSDSDRPEYGPGIVRLLRDKFLQMADAASREADANKWSHSKARKATSCESLLDGPMMQSQPTPPVTPQKHFGSTVALDSQPPDSPKGPPLPVASLKARFESPDAKLPTPKKAETTPVKREPEFLTAFRRLRSVPAECSPAKRDPPPSDPSPLASPSLRLPALLPSPASDASPPPEEPHPPLFDPPSPALPSPVLDGMPDEALSSDSESGLVGSYDITPVPSSDSVPRVAESSEVTKESSDEALPPSPVVSSDDGEAAQEKTPPSQEQQEILKAFADNIVKGIAGTPSAGIDKELIVRLLEEYRSVLPLVAEEDLPQLLAPERSFHYEFEGEHGMVPRNSSLAREPKPAKGSVGFSDSPIRAYAYVRQSSEEEMDTHWDWVQGIELDAHGYTSLCHEVRKSREEQWSEVNNWVENVDQAWAAKPPMPSGGGLVSYVPAQLQNADLSSDFDSSWNYGTSEKVAATPEVSVPAPQPASFSQNEESTPDLLF